MALAAIAALAQAAYTSEDAKKVIKIVGVWVAGRLRILLTPCDAEAIEVTKEATKRRTQEIKDTANNNKRKIEEKKHKRIRNANEKADQKELNILNKKDEALTRRREKLISRDPGKAKLLRYQGGVGTVGSGEGAVD